MREMKDSGIEWIGDIPTHWKVSRIKYVAEFYNGDRGKNYPSGDDLVDDGIAFLTSNNIHGIFIDCSPEKTKYISEERYNLLGGAKLQINDIIYCLRGSVGTCAINLDLKCGTVASSLVDIRPQGIIPMFLNYYLQSPANFIQTMAYMNGSCAANLSAENVSTYYVIEPPISEQQRIADFLDGKCGEIDGLVADIQSQIDTLEQYKCSAITETVTKGLNPDAQMKDSGIEWVGMIPKHWKVMPNKYIMHKVKEICPVYSGEDILSLTMRGVIVRDLDAGGKMPTSFDGYQRLKSGNLLMCLFDIDVTPRCIGLIKNNGLSSPAYSQFEMHKGAIAEYYYYYYLMVDFTKELLHMAKNLRHSLTEEQLGAISTPVPPIQEQKQIAAYLDRKCTEIDSIIDRKKEQLTVLDNYKKSLIYEYVTGKKEVPVQ